jgi:hypothetical protein
MEQVGIEDFLKLDIRVARVLSAERVEGSEKLLKLRVSLGDEERTLVAGIGKHYIPEELVGKKGCHAGKPKTSQDLWDRVPGHDLGGGGRRKSFCPSAGKGC